MSSALPAAAGVLGSGEVGRVLAAGLAARGVATTLGTRRPDDPELCDWAAENGVVLGGFGDAARAGPLAILAVRGAGEAIGGALDLAGEDALDGRVLIDATNPLVLTGEGPELEVGHRDSGGERLQRRLPRTHVVKAFNTVGNALMVDPSVPSGRPTMFIAGDDASAKEMVSALLDAFGWNAFDVGGIERSRELESLCVLWVAVAGRRGRRDHVITLEHASPAG